MRDVGRYVSTFAPGRRRVDGGTDNGVGDRGSALRLIAAGLGLGIAAGAAAGIGWYFSGMLPDPTVRPLYPERVLAADARHGHPGRQPG